MFLLLTVFIQLQGSDVFDIMLGILILEIFAYFFAFVLGVLIALVVGFLHAFRSIVKTMINSRS